MDFPFGASVIDAVPAVQDRRRWTTLMGNKENPAGGGAIFLQTGGAQNSRRISRAAGIGELIQ